MFKEGELGEFENKVCTKLDAINNYKRLQKVKELVKISTSFSFNKSDCKFAGDDLVEVVRGITLAHINSKLVSLEKEIRKGE